MTRNQIIDRYVAYLDVCNRHAWDELAPFLAEMLTVNGLERTTREYQADLAELDHAFPDYRWELRRTVIEGAWLAVCLRAYGTRTGAFRTAPGDGAQIETIELNMYRFDESVMQELVGTADNARLIA